MMLYTKYVFKNNNAHNYTCIYEMYLQQGARLAISILFYKYASAIHTLQLFSFRK